MGFFFWFAINAHIQPFCMQVAWSWHREKSADQQVMICMVVFGLTSDMIKDASYMPSSKR